jgi:hypothetical protein
MLPQKLQRIKKKIMSSNFFPKNHATYENAEKSGTA